MASLSREDTMLQGLADAHCLTDWHAVTVPI